jgi:cell division protein FtsW
MFVLGMLASFARTEPDAVVALHARGRTKWTKLLGIPLPPKPRPARDARPAREAAAAATGPASGRGRGQALPRQRGGAGGEAS